MHLPLFIICSKMTGCTRYWWEFKALERSEVAEKCTVRMVRSFVCPDTLGTINVLFCAFYEDL